MKQNQGVITVTVGIAVAEVVVLVVAEAVVGRFGGGRSSGGRFGGGRSSGGRFDGGRGGRGGRGRGTPYKPSVTTAASGTKKTFHDED
ncbi:hypothetical protein OIU76_002510 [Salix suchowensis]|nr:hypothetical protein OIU76_002510 [Salix suchowensis]